MSAMPTTSPYDFQCVDGIIITSLKAPWGSRSAEKRRCAAFVLGPREDDPRLQRRAQRGGPALADGSPEFASWPWPLRRAYFLTKALAYCCVTPLYVAAGAGSPCFTSTTWIASARRDIPWVPACSPFLAQPIQP